MWSLKKFHRVGELIAVFAVVVSLIFVGIEIAQNNQLTRETSTQRLVSELRSVQRALSDNADFACLYGRATQDYLSLSGSERLRFSGYVLSLFQVYQEMHILMRRDRIEPEIWQGAHALLLESMQLRGLQEWFTTRRHWFSEDFQQYIEGLIGQYPMENVIIYDDPTCSPSGGN